MKFVDNSHVPLDRLFALYERQDFCDIQLKVGNLRYSTHRMVLCMSSDVFRTMLTSNTWPESRSNLVVLQEDPECAEVFGLFLKYLYKGQVLLNKNNVLPLLTLADKYNVSDLSRSCLVFMQENASPECKHVIIPWLQYAVICGYKETEDACRTFMTYNFEALLNTPEFMDISKEILISFLTSSNLVVNGEYSLYKAVKKWLTVNDYYNTGEPNAMFKSVMQHVRFPMMHLSDIATLQNDRFVNCHQDFYLSNIFSAMKYHTSSIESSSDNIGCMRLWNTQFMPRIYETECWSTNISIENMLTVKVGEVRGAFFTTPASCSDADSHSHLDWHVMFYPKGVQYEKCVMIGVPNNNTIPGNLIKSVRLALSTRCEVMRRFKITVLVVAIENGEEYVCQALTRDAIFDKNCSLFNFENVVPYENITRRDVMSLKVKIIVSPVYLF